jgi:hypothetical protein
LFCPNFGDTATLEITGVAVWVSFATEMPIQYQQIPLQKLLCEDATGEYPFRSKEEEAKDIQAIRLYRASKNDPKFQVVGSDIFLIEAAIKEKLAIYNQKDGSLKESPSTREKDVEKLPKLSAAKGRRLKKVDDFPIFPPLTIALCSPLSELSN